MAFVAAKCTECGASIEVDNSKEVGFCRHCGTTFVTQKAINQHNAYFTQHVTKNVYGREKTEAEEYLARGEVFLKLKDWNRAADAFMCASEVAPHDYRCWLGLIRSETENFTDLDDVFHIEHYIKAVAVADEEEKIIINDLCEKFVHLSKEHRKEQETVKKARQDEVNILKQEKIEQQKRTNKLYILFLTIGTVCLFGAVIVFAFCAIASWIIMVPIGSVLTIAVVIIWIVAFKAERKSRKLLQEILEIKEQNSNADVQIQDVFKNFGIFQ